MLSERDSESHAGLVGAPDVFVKLDLHPNWQAVFKDSFSQPFWRHAGKRAGRSLRRHGRRNQDFSSRQSGFDQVPRERVVFGRADHELDFVGLFQPLKVFAKSSSAHSAGGSLDVHHDSSSAHEVANRNLSVGLDAHLIMFPVQRVEKRGGLSLKQGFASREERVLDAVGSYFRDHCRNGHLFSAFEGVGRVAIGASKIAAGESNECEWKPAQGSFPLEAVKNLGDQ